MKYEYKVINHDRTNKDTFDVLLPSIETELNELGNDSWELVSSVDLNTFIFKRPKTSKKDREQSLLKG